VTGGIMDNGTIRYIVVNPLMNDRFHPLMQPYSYKLLPTARPDYDRRKLWP